MPKCFSDFKEKCKRFFKESADIDMKVLSLSPSLSPSSVGKEVQNPEHQLIFDQPPNIFEYIENFDVEWFLKKMIPPRLQKFVRGIPWNKWVDTPDGGRVMLLFDTGQMLYKIDGKLYTYDIMSGELVEYYDGTWTVQTDPGSQRLLLIHEGTGHRWEFYDGQWWFYNGDDWEIWDM